MQQYQNEFQTLRIGFATAVVEKTGCSSAEDSSTDQEHAPQVRSGSDRKLAMGMTDRAATSMVGIVGWSSVCHWESVNSCDSEVNFRNFEKLSSERIPGPLIRDIRGTQSPSSRRCKRRVRVESALMSPRLMSPEE